MHENAWGRVTFLVTLIFGRLDTFDGSIFGGGRNICGEGGSYIQDVTRLNICGTYIWDSLYKGGVITGFYSTLINALNCFNLEMELF